jgi:hypothetical protein
MKKPVYCKPIDNKNHIQKHSVRGVGVACEFKREHTMHVERLFLIGISSDHTGTPRPKTRFLDRTNSRYEWFVTDKYIDLALLSIKLYYSERFYIDV